MCYAQKTGIPESSSIPLPLLMLSPRTTSPCGVEDYSLIAELRKDMILTIIHSCIFMLHIDKSCNDEQASAQQGMNLYDDHKHTHADE